MNLSPEIVDALRSHYATMGYEFNPDALSQFKTDGPDMIGLARSMGLSIEEIAKVLIEKFTVANIEAGLPTCVQSFGDDATLISMPLDDLRFACGYLALVEAGAPISLEQTKRAIRIAGSLTVAAMGAASRGRVVPPAAM